MSATPITTPLVIGWLVTAAGIAGSLGWNYFNYRRTISTAERLRIEQYKSAQWTRIRTGIDGALEGLVDASRVILRQAQELKDDQFNNNATSLLQSFLIDAQDSLASALEEADKSAYCDNVRWSDAANGDVHGTETSWDRVIAVLAEADASATKPQLVEALRKLKSPIAEIRDCTRSMCRTQDMALDPERL